MPHLELLGRVASLPVVRFGPPGAFLGLRRDAPDPQKAPVILLPGAEVPEGTEVGDELDVFVTLDSEDRPLATLARPRLALGQVAFLEVTDVTRIGAFVDWGLPKELLVPHALQTAELRVGQRYAVGLVLDDTGRLAGTMRVAELLRDRRAYDVGEWVAGEAWRNEPGLGLFVIVEKRQVGLVPASEPHGLSRGEAARFRVSHVHADGKIELSLRGLAHEEQGRDAAHVLARLREGGLRVNDRSSPEDLRDHFGLSKKAFKRAVGRLLRDEAVTLDADGFLTPARAASRPAPAPAPAPAPTRNYRKGKSKQPRKG